MQHFNSNKFERVMAMDFSNNHNEEHCCHSMKIAAEFKCTSCASPFDCPDSLIYYSPQFSEYGIIIHDGSGCYILISYCPFCGARLPESRRDEWFDLLEELGFDEPFGQDIPEKFKSGLWMTDEN